MLLEKGAKALGKVFHVIGPLYVVRFNSEQHVRERGVTRGMIMVYFAPKTEHTTFVFLDQLMKMKTSDVSWCRWSQLNRSNLCSSLLRLWRCQARSCWLGWST